MLLILRTLLSKFQCFVWCAISCFIERLRWMKEALIYSQFVKSGMDAEFYQLSSASIHRRNICFYFFVLSFKMVIFNVQSYINVELCFPDINQTLLIAYLICFSNALLWNSQFCSQRAWWVCNFLSSAFVIGFLSKNISDLIKYFGGAASFSIV